MTAVAAFMCFGTTDGECMPNLSESLIIKANGIVPASFIIIFESLLPPAAVAILVAGNGRVTVSIAAAYGVFDFFVRDLAVFVYKIKIQFCVHFREILDAVLAFAKISSFTI